MSVVRLTRVEGESGTTTIINPDKFLWAEDRARRTNGRVGYSKSDAEEQRMTVLVFAGTSSTLCVTESVEEVAEKLDAWYAVNRPSQELV